MLALTRLRGRSRYGVAKARSLTKGEGGRCYVFSDLLALRGLA